MEVSDQLHASATLPPGTESQIPRLYEVGWAHLVLNSEAAERKWYWFLVLLGSACLLYFVLSIPHTYSTFYKILVMLVVHFLAVTIAQT
jgi:hypothetical protein